MPGFVAKWLGIDVTTTEMALAVSNAECHEGFASIKMRGATHWNADSTFPAFDLAVVPGMFRELLAALRRDGWSFDEEGWLSIACRQHDLVMLDRNRSPLLPALSWQCNAAAEEMRQLNADTRVTETVGLLEERFILPKLAHVLNRDSTLRGRVASVMTTGDWILGSLCGDFSLSTSDALSNGLLNQQSRELAGDILTLAGLDPSWFPPAVQSGFPIGCVSASLDSEWKEIGQTLGGWRAVAGLGDNHASALGCGMTDEQTLVVSAGTSGTVNLARPANAKLNAVEQPAARFEFYRERSLLLRMLAYCGDWYNRFLSEFASDFRDAHGLLNSLASSADLTQVERIECDAQGELYRPGWTRLSLARKVASVQLSIAQELLAHVGLMLDEVPNARQQITRYVLTGGLSQSPFFQQVFREGIDRLDPHKQVKVSGRSGPLRYKTSAYGALLNARMPEWGHNLDNVPAELFPLSDCAGEIGGD